MSTKLAVENHKNLYELWTEKVTDYLNKELKKDELFINLASNEYAKAVDKKKLKTEMISPVFKDFKHGKLKVIAFDDNKARGSKVSDIIDKNISYKERILCFDYIDYKYSEKYTEKENQPVFIR